MRLIKYEQAHAVSQYICARRLPFRHPCQTLFSYTSINAIFPMESQKIASEQVSSRGQSPVTTERLLSNFSARFLTKLLRSADK